ncbi:MAG: hypothetical protein AB1331_03795 [Bacillota bacterium]
MRHNGDTSNRKIGDRSRLPWWHTEHLASDMEIAEEIGAHHRENPLRVTNYLTKTLFLTGHYQDGIYF